VITIALAGAAERAQRFAAAADRLQQRFAPSHSLPRVRKRSGVGVRGQLVQARQRFRAQSPDRIAALEAIVMDELEA